MPPTPITPTFSDFATVVFLSSIEARFEIAHPGQLRQNFPGSFRRATVQEVGSPGSSARKELAQV